MTPANDLASRLGDTLIEELYRMKVLAADGPIEATGVAVVLDESAVVSWANGYDAAWRQVRAALASDTDVLAKVRADAWDEGWRAAALEFDTATKVENPYRVKASDNDE